MSSYNILDYGAAGDGRTNDGPAIQRAIDACHEAGGGRVLVPAGTYKSGSIVLKSHVEFHLETGAVIRGSEKLEDYHVLDTGGENQMAQRPAGVPSYINSEYHGAPFQYFVFAKDGEDIQITGHGAIDGNEKMYHAQEGRYHIEGQFYPRIPVVLIEHVQHLTVKEVTLTGSAFWTLHMIGCEDVLVDGIRILNSLVMANSDGIDPDHCRNVRIVNCHIECADDCICLKNTKSYEKYGSCENIVISGCTLITTSAAIKFGSESESDFRNVVVDNCIITRSNRGFAIQLRDKGNIEHVLVSNLIMETRRFSEEWWGRGEPIYITAHNRKTGVVAGQIRDVQLRNIVCTGENGIFIRGSEGHILKDISLENISVNLKKTSKWPTDSYDLRPFEGDGVLRSKIYGLYAEKADGLRLNGVRFSCDESMEHFHGGETHYDQVSNLQED